MKVQPAAATWQPRRLIPSRRAGRAGRRRAAAPRGAAGEKVEAATKDAAAAARRAGGEAAASAGKAGEVVKGSVAQLLGMKGADAATNIWKIRLQLTKPVTWVPLIWGAPCPFPSTPQHLEGPPAADQAGHVGAAHLGCAAPWPYQTRARRLPKQPAGLLSDLLRSCILQRAPKAAVLCSKRCSRLNVRWHGPCIEGSGRKACVRMCQPAMPAK